ncbi:S8 family serine peptidase [Streptomyces sp. WI04-05B]|uniref:S8 family serine peptidase n=1 Tax=Streptomyces TaxID=1883 RepID=UPI0029BB24D2|nr:MULTISPECIES: S8 family serine peptidase [Streptomyces]MDX2548631.1 S8 family serine peptidase [Streptomyces sp. WI04-05B]MDX2589047.1 S8 family serine peptidase [Streptomyces sp. WI04-05A]
MTRTPIRPRAAITTLAPLLAGALTLMAVIAPTSTASDTNSTGGKGSYGDDTYIVKLADPPVAAYEGGLPRLQRTAPTAGKRLDADSATVEKYVAHLDDRRERVLDAVPGVETLYDYSYTFSGFAAELTGRQAAKLASTPGVVSVTRNTVAQLTSTGPDDGQRADGRAETYIRTVADGQDGTEGKVTAFAAQQPTPSGGVSGPQGQGLSGARGTARSALTGPAEVRTPHTPGSQAPRTARHAQFPDTPRLLGLSGAKGLWAKAGGPEHAGEGVIVGIVDTGFDPSNPMFAALPNPRPDAGAIARKWHGDCDPGDDPTHKVTCNNKVIGAQWFGAGVPADREDAPSPLDTSSHGTHTGSTAAGNHGVAASVPGSNAEGRLSGVAPAARLAFYKACWPGFGCPTVDLTAAIDRAVADGVDVINFSITGTLTEQPDMEAMFNAAKAGVFVAAAANNGGPDSVHHTGPWVTTVAASSHDTQYTTSLVLGDGRRYTRVGLNPGAGSAPLVEAAAVRKDGSDAGRAALCAPGTLDPAQAKGKIIVCDRGGAGIWEDDKSDEVLAVGGKGLVLTDTPAYDEFLPPYVFSVPLIQLDLDDAKAVHAYASQAGATARFTPTQSSHRATREIASFSSSGPDHFSDGDLLKPDIASFGQTIPAGVVPGSTSYYPGRFSFSDGTSMASPHIAGLAALLRQLHSDWSPMEIKSALMTTATPTDENGDPIGRELADSASPLDYGAGLPRVTRATDPGLVYDSTSADWTAYLCAIGQKPTTEDGTDACATATKTDPSDLNYPSIAVGDLLAGQTVTRTVTNVSARTATYRANLQTPPGFRAEVTPKRLTVTPGASASYKVTFERTSAAHNAWSFGSLTWSDAHSHHEVTSPVALRSVALSAPKEAVVTGGDSATLRPAVDWNGELTAKASLYTGEKTTGTLTGTDQADFTMSQGTNDAVVKHHVHVPAGTPFTRFAITSADHVPGSNLDLYAFDTNGNHIGDWAGPGSDEHVDLPPVDYDVYVRQSELPTGTTSQQYTVRSWKVGQGTPAVTPTVTPSEQNASAGDRPDVTVSWPDAKRGQQYVGAVEYGDGSTTLGHTALTATP